MSSGDRVEFLLRNTKCGSTTTERRIALEALGDAFGGNTVGEAPNELILGEIPLAHHLGGSLTQELMLNSAA